jgi:hypothetical protein
VNYLTFVDRFLNDAAGRGRIGRPSDECRLEQYGTGDMCSKSKLPMVLVFLVSYALSNPQQTHAQDAAALSSAKAPLVTRGLEYVSEEHYGIYCINYSGVTSSPKYIDDIRAGKADTTVISLNAAFINSISSDTWKSVLAAYAAYQTMFNINTNTSQAAALQLLLQSSIDVLGKDTEAAKLANQLLHNDNDISIDDVYDKIMLNQNVSVGIASKFMGMSEYIDNVSQWRLSPAQLRGQALAELAFALFREGKASEAQRAAYASLEALSLSPKRYSVTDQDDVGHRRPQFSANLAFLMAKLADFTVASERRDPTSAFAASVDLAQHFDDLEPMLWYLTKKNPWPAGEETYAAMLNHLVSNLPVVINPKGKRGSTDQLGEFIDAYWQDPEDNSVFIVVRKDKKSPERITLQISAEGGGGWAPPGWVSGNNIVPPPPSGPRFYQGSARPIPRTLLVAGDPARDRLIKYLRRQIDANSTPEVALFTAIKEGPRYRLIVPTSRLKDLPEEAKQRLEQYDTFLVSEDELAGIGHLDAANPLRFVFEGLGNATFTMYAAPHTLRTGEFQRGADSLAFVLASHFPEISIYRDYYTASTNPRSTAMAARTFGTPDRYVIIRASNETAVKDIGIINNIIKPTLGDLKVPVETYNGKNAVELGQKLGGKKLNVIVVTAHSADSLKKMVYDLSDAGTFKDNVVIFVTCRTELTRHLTEYIGGRGADGVVVFDRAIKFDDAGRMFAGLRAEFLQKGSADLSFRKAILDAFSSVVGIISVSQRQLKQGLLAHA